MKHQKALAQQICVNDTFVLVTHKMEMLQLVDRVIVVADHRIVMDGPKGEVLARLQGGPPQATPANGPAPAPTPSPVAAAPAGAAA